MPRKPVYVLLFNNSYSGPEEREFMSVHSNPQSAEKAAQQDYDAQVQKRRYGYYKPLKLEFTEDVERPGEMTSQEFDSSDALSYSYFQVPVYS